MKGVGMLIKRQVKTSFKSKLLILFLTAGLIPLIASAALYQRIISGMIMESSENASIENMKYVSFNIQRQMEAAEQLLGWITYNQDLQEILTMNTDRLYEKQLAAIEFSSYVTEYCINADMENKVQKILIMDDDGFSFQIGNNYSYLREDEILGNGWMERYEKDTADEMAIGYDWYKQEGYVFPMSRRIYDSLTGKPLGWCLIVFADSLYSDFLAQGEGGEKTFVVNMEGQCIADMDEARLGMDLSEDSLVSAALNQTAPQGNVMGEYQGEPSILHYARIPDTSVIQIRTTPLEEFLLEKRNMTRLSAMVTAGTAAVLVLVIIYLGNVLMRPINRISSYIKTVPENGFKGNLTLDGDDEFKKIAQAINEMEQEILHLMENQKKQAKIEKELEFKVLQNQINPHFLYNTLNSIKWMATLQHADTIRDMTAALGRLLQNIAKGADVKIPIYEEMSLLDDYVLIQDIRYDGKIKVKYHIGNGEITRAYILKFLLQPIVENAVFHGIEPKEGEGMIDLYLTRENEDILIAVEDNGVGMTDEQIRQLFDPDSVEKNHRGLNGIGVLNVHERIQMVYGKRYGLSIASQPGCFTRVTIRIPYEKEG